MCCAGCGSCLDQVVTGRTLEMASFSSTPRKPRYSHNSAFLPRWGVYKIQIKMFLLHDSYQGSPLRGAGLGRGPWDLRCSFHQTVTEKPFKADKEASKVVWTFKSCTRRLLICRTK